MHQLVTRIDDDLLREIDALVASGVAESRSDAVRVALAYLLDRHRRAEDTREIVQSYRARPQTEEELDWAHAAAVGMIAEEPW